MSYPLNGHALSLLHEPAAAPREPEDYRFFFGMTRWRPCTTRLYANSAVRSLTTRTTAP